MMTPQEIAKFIQAEFQVHKEWLTQAKQMRENAVEIEKWDMTLATLLRLHAGIIEQYQQRIISYTLQHSIQSADEQTTSEEDEVIIQELFSRIRRGS